MRSCFISYRICQGCDLRSAPRERVAHSRDNLYKIEVCACGGGMVVEWGSEQVIARVKEGFPEHGISGMLNKETQLWWTCSRPLRIYKSSTYCLESVCTEPTSMVLSGNRRSWTVKKYLHSYNSDWLCQQRIFPAGQGRQNSMVNTLSKVGLQTSGNA
jgi:hypothetical protein